MTLTIGKAGIVFREHEVWTTAEILQALQKAGVFDTETVQKSINKLNEFSNDLRNCQPTDYDGELAYADLKTIILELVKEIKN